MACQSHEANPSLEEARDWQCATPSRESTQPVVEDDSPPRDFIPTTPVDVLQTPEPSRIGEENEERTGSTGKTLFSGERAVVKVEKSDVVALAELAREDACVGRRHAGYMVKQGHFNTMSWRRRWFVARAPFLFYYKGHDRNATVVGAILLDGAKVDLLAPRTVRYHSIVAAAQAVSCDDSEEMKRPSYASEWLMRRASAAFGGAASTESAAVLETVQDGDVGRVVMVQSASGREYILVAETGDAAKLWRDELRSAAWWRGDVVDAKLVCADATARLARLECERLRSEGERLRSERDSAKGSCASLEAELQRSNCEFEHALDNMRKQRNDALSALGVVSAPLEDSAAENSVVAAEGRVRIWVGTWNLGAVEPFSAPRQRARAGRLLRCGFVPCGYDVYCLGVQEAVSESIYETIESLLSLEDCERVLLTRRAFPAATTAHGQRQKSRQTRSATVKQQPHSSERHTVVHYKTSYRLHVGKNSSSVEEAFDRRGYDYGSSEKKDDVESSAHLAASPAESASVAPPTLRIRLTANSNIAHAVSTQPVHTRIVDAEEERLAISCATARGRDRVEGRGDGSLIGTKFTGVAVFARRSLVRQGRIHVLASAAHCVQQYSSKGGAATVLRIDLSTLCFVTCHLEAKRHDERRRQYRELVQVLGGALADRPGVDLTSLCDHLVFAGDLNFKMCVGGSGPLKTTTEVLDPDAAISLLDARHGCQFALDRHDQLKVERLAEEVFYGFLEPIPPPDFAPTYKKRTEHELSTGRYRRDIPPVSTPGWASTAYVTRFREPLYKGGRTTERTPGFCDRILVRSIDREALRLWPEKLPDGKMLLGADTGPLPPGTIVAAHNYRTGHGHDGMAASDHTPVFAGFHLDSKFRTSMVWTDSAALRFPLISMSRRIGLPSLQIGVFDLAVSNIRVSWGSAITFPLAVRALIPLPYEFATSSSTPFSVHLLSPLKPLESGGWRQLASPMPGLSCGAEATRTGDTRTPGNNLALDTLSVRFDVRDVDRPLAHCHFLLRLAVSEESVVAAADAAIHAKAVDNTPIKDRIRASRIVQCVFPLRAVFERESNSAHDHKYPLERDSLPFYAIDPSDMSRHRGFLHCSVSLSRKIGDDDIVTVR